MTCQTLLLAFALATLAPSAQAQGCPDFFRFVDFGITDDKGNHYRGGTLLRAEDFDGQALAMADQTICLTVSETLRDGRGNPMPVVSRISYAPDMTGLPVSALSVMAVGDPVHLAETSAAAHIAALDSPDAAVTTGTTFRCVNAAAGGTFSCQLTSPFPGNAALVVYCEASQCRLPAMAINDQLVVTAQWDKAAAGTGESLSALMQGIHDFLTPLTAGF